MNKRNLIPIIFFTGILFFVILKTNVGGLFFAVLILAAFAGLVNFYGKTNKAKEDYKKSYQVIEEKEYYDPRTRTMRKMK